MPPFRSLVPTSLVMRPDVCFYCQEEPTCDIHTHMRTFGIRSCNIHKTYAKRDCNAYLHSIGKVTLYDAEQNAAIMPFLALLENEVYILRTNGNLDDCWTLNKHDIYEPLPLTCLNGEWVVPMIRKGHITKNVEIKSFLSPVVKSANKDRMPDDLEDRITNALKALDDGLYITDFNAHNLLGEPGSVQETSGITSVWAPNGEVRVVCG